MRAFAVKTVELFCIIIFALSQILPGYQFEINFDLIFVSRLLTYSLHLLALQQHSHVSYSHPVGVNQHQGQQQSGCPLTDIGMSTKPNRHRLMNPKNRAKVCPKLSTAQLLGLEVNNEDTSCLMVLHTQRMVMRLQSGASNPVTPRQHSKP